MSHSPSETKPDEGYSDRWRAMLRMLESGRSLSGRERNRCFLNLGALPFANVSAISGLDFADDGRGLALADWDLDGDLDLWFSNRNAPRVRFLRNDVQAGNHFLTIGLQGTVSNRDAVGARLELQLAGTDPPKLIRTLRAGEGFLSQSSKWVHFGLGDNPHIERLVVRWPGGEPEVFPDLEADRWYRIIQGTGEAELWEPPRAKSRLVASKLEVRTSGKTRLAEGLKTLGPALEYLDSAGDPVSVSLQADTPLLLNLWATWCGPCRSEIRGWVREERQLEASGLRILALNVDGLVGDESLDASRASQFLAELGYPFESGRATSRLLDELVRLKQRVLDEEVARLSLPTSLLLDPRGRLRVVYEGETTPSELLEDVRWVGAQ